jgi:hypothetical protein
VTEIRKYIDEKSQEKQPTQTHQKLELIVNQHSEVKYMEDELSEEKTEKQRTKTPKESSPKVNIDFSVLEEALQEKTEADKKRIDEMTAKYGHDDAEMAKIDAIKFYKDSIEIAGIKFVRENMKASSNTKLVK